MLEKKTKVDQRTQLLQAREEGLKSLQNGVLKPHGKLLGMDVFSWLNPDVHMLMNTLHSFPFPVIWIAQKMDWDALLNLDNTILSNLCSRCIPKYPPEKWTYNYQIFEDPIDGPNYLGCNLSSMEIYLYLVTIFNGLSNININNIEVTKGDLECDIYGKFYVPTSFNFIEEKDHLKLNYNINILD